MRLAAQVKAGFYPAHEVAIEGILKHLVTKAPDPTKKLVDVHIIDPCCGKGAAINQIAQGLGVPQKNVYTIELDPGRSEEAKALMPDHNHLGPASFLGAAVSGCSFGLAYVNPPFDDELGGGKREEYSFVQQATKTLATGGILALVCPLRALSGNYGFVDFLDSYYTDISVYKFPTEHRHYNEIVVFARKRSGPIPNDRLPTACLHLMNMHWGYLRMEAIPELGGLQPVSYANGVGSYERDTDIRIWEIPCSWKPSVFKKTAFTEDELRASVDASPLNRLLKEVVIPPPAAPPLPLDKGHIGLLLASGFLDGVISTPYGPHVVRGSSHKTTYRNREAEPDPTMNPETGAVTSTEVWSERMVTVIRCVESDGVIRTFSNDAAEKEENEEAEEAQSRMAG